MRVGLLSPSIYPEPTGNAVTAQRILIGLSREGVKADACRSTIDFTKVQEWAEEFQPDVIHALHAYRGGRVGLKLARKLGIPLVVTLTGTDVNLDLYDGTKRAEIFEVLKNANHITAFHIALLEKLLQELPDLSSNISIVKQTPFLPKATGDYRKAWNFSKDNFIFFLPTGIRRVKNPLFVVAALRKTVTKHADARLVIAGPIIEDDLVAKLRAELRGLDWARFAEPIPHPKMYAAYTAVDAVISASTSEGGMSNVILESLSLGKVVMASNIEGNRTIIQDGVNGLLYDSEKEFDERAGRLLSDRSFGEMLSKNAKAMAMKQFDPKAEIDAYLKIYRELA